MYELVDHTENINRLAAFPLCPLPRIISAKEFNFLNRGLSQRVKALNFSWHYAGFMDMQTDSSFLMEEILEIVPLTEVVLKDLHLSNRIYM